MDAQRSALDVEAQNVARAEIAEPGSSFARLVPQFAVAPDGDGGVGEEREPPDPEAEDAAPVRFLGVRRAAGGAPDASAEMVAVLDAQRAFEANAAVFDLGKRLAERTVELGRP